MTASVRISLEELRRLRAMAHPPDPKAMHTYFCSCCDRPYKTQGISLLCPHCLSWAVKHGLSDVAEASGS